jgi:Na+/H+ antiporter NhaD/arsenite permease-like protein
MILFIIPLLTFSVAFSIYFVILLRAAKLSAHKSSLRSLRKKAVLIAIGASTFVAITVESFIHETDISSGILSAGLLILVGGIVLYALALHLMR